MIIDSSDEMTIDRAIQNLDSVRHILTDVDDNILRNPDLMIEVLNRVEGVLHSLHIWKQTAIRT